MAAQRLAQKAAEKKTPNTWINAWTEPMAGVCAPSSCFLTCGMFLDLLLVIFRIISDLQQLDQVAMSLYTYYVSKGSS